MPLRMFVAADIVKSRMNAACARGEAFLCAVDFEVSQGIFFTAAELAGRGDIAFRTPGAGHVPPGFAAAGAEEGALKIHPIAFADYKKAFARVRAALLRGDTYLANLTARTPVETGLSFETIFARSDSPYALWVKDRFVCFSPESFVRVDAAGEIATFPMKGTAPADAPGALDRLLNNEKERREQHTIVDLLRNDLNAVADGVCVPRFRYVEKIARARGGDLLQVSSEVRGHLRARALGDVLFSLLPAGSVSGAPKEKTVQILREAEGGARGFYTGVFGWFDGQTFDSGVLIRYIERTAEGLFYRSGGGITAQSCAESEYDELLHKIYLPFHTP